jgi:protein Tex
MKEFSSYIADTWNIREPVAKEITQSFEKGDSPLYCADYCKTISAEADLSQLWPIFDFLKDVSALIPQKKRLVNALKKAGKLNEEINKRISLCINPYEIDDMLLPERPNPRSKAQIALKKGLGVLADKILLQEDGGEAVEEAAAPFVGTDPTLASVDDVISDVKDILAERFAYDETARMMVREFAYDDGFFEVQLKNKKDPEFSRYAEKPVEINTISKEDILILLSAEEKKTIRLKLGVQLFRISELIKHHFITNPDCAGFDIICQAIDDCWTRLLQPIVERDVKDRLRREAEKFALAEISMALMKKIAEDTSEGSFLVISVLAAKNIVLTAFNAQGRLVGASLDKKPAPERPVSERLKQFFNRYRPSLIIIPNDENADNAENIVNGSIDIKGNDVKIVRTAITPSALELSRSDWMKNNFSDLDDSMRKAFAIGLSYIQPITLMPIIGIRYFSINPLQNYISEKHSAEIVERALSEIVLREGIPINDAGSIALHLLPTITEPVINALMSAEAKKNYATKNDLLKLPGISETIFRNIAGYIVIPYSENPLDRTTVHPDHYKWVSDMCGELSLSLDAVVNNPESLRSVSDHDMENRIFLEKKLISQLETGQKFAATVFSKHRKKAKLDELTEGTVVSGHVTNITPFGVFVNINAVCEGLIHISQLADTYIETPEQVVTLGQTINVRIIKIDPKKRRISLSMKGLSAQPVKVAPSKRQLSSLASHFQNR